MSFRGLLTLALLIAAVGAERAAYFSWRSLILFDMREQGLPTTQLGIAFAAMQVGGLIGGFAGGGLALGIGARFSALGGMVLSLLGFICLVAGAPLVLSGLIISVGAAAFRVCLYAVAAEQVTMTEVHPGAVQAPSRQRFAAMAAFAVIASGAANLSGVAAPASVGFVMTRLGTTIAHVASFALDALATLFVGGAVLVGVLGKRPSSAPVPPQAPYRGAEPPAPVLEAPTSSNAIGGAALLALCIAVFDAASAAGMPQLQHLSASAYGQLLAAGSVVALLATGAMFVVLLIAILTRWPFPLLSAFGAGLAIAGVGILVEAIAGETLALLYVGTALASVGIATLPTVGLAYTALAVRPRFAALAIASWQAVGSVASMVGSPIAGSDLRVPFLVVASVAAFCGGVAITSFGRRLERWFA